MCYISSMYPKKKQDEAANAEFLNRNGELFGRILAADWMAPNRVELSKGMLKIRSVHPYWSDAKPGFSGGAVELKRRCPAPEPSTYTSLRPLRPKPNRSFLGPFIG